MIQVAANAQAYSGPAFFSLGLRPFFFAAALFAALVMPLWVLFLAGLFTPSTTDLSPMRWHAHEMIFGYLGAVIGGFLLTAIPNWTERAPIAGIGLASLLALWLAGRIGFALATLGFAPLATAAVLDLLFPVALIAACTREIAAARGWRNLPIIGLIGVFGAANFLFYIGSWIELDPVFGERLAVAVAASLISLIGGRITPSFTRNWLALGPGEPLPAAFGVVDKTAIALTATGLLAWVFAPGSPVTGSVLALAGVAQLVRLSRWQGRRVLREPLLVILHIGYGWLVIALLAMSAAILTPWIGAGPALHALTAGAIGVMTLAVMTRASLGHTGRVLTADRATVLIYALVNLGALLRVAAGWMPFDYTQAAACAGILWSSAFLVFLGKYGPYLLRCRIDE